jgi:hypothetical protein
MPEPPPVTSPATPAGAPLSSTQRAAAQCAALEADAAHFVDAHTRADDSVRWKVFVGCTYVRVRTWKHALEAAYACVLALVAYAACVLALVAYAALTRKSFTAADVVSRALFDGNVAAARAALDEYEAHEAARARALAGARHARAALVAACVVACVLGACAVGALYRMTSAAWLNDMRPSPHSCARVRAVYEQLVALRPDNATTTLLARITYANDSVTNVTRVLPHYESMPILASARDAAVALLEEAAAIAADVFALASSSLVAEALVALALALIVASVGVLLVPGVAAAVRGATDVCQVCVASARRARATALDWLAPRPGTYLVVMLAACATTLFAIVALMLATPWASTAVEYVAGRTLAHPIAWTNLAIAMAAAALYASVDAHPGVAPPTHARVTVLMARLADALPEARARALTLNSAAHTLAFVGGRVMYRGPIATDDIGHVRTPASSEPREWPLACVGRVARSYVQQTMIYSTTPTTRTTTTGERERVSPPPPTSEWRWYVELELEYARMRPSARAALARRALTFEVAHATCADSAALAQSPETMIGVTATRTATAPVVEPHILATGVSPCTPTSSSS